MIIYSGIQSDSKEIKFLTRHFTLHKVNNADEAIRNDLLAKSEVYLIGAENNQLVREIQKIYEADKHLSLVILAEPTIIRRVNQSILFAPFIGKNTLVIALGPELDLTGISNNAAARTRQKRKFFEMKIADAVQAPTEKIRIAQMDSFLQHAPIAAILVSEDFKIENYNQQAKKLFPALTQLKSDISQIFSAEQVISIRNFIETNKNPESKLESELGHRILELTSSEVYSEEGQKYYLLLFSDVTSERQESDRILSILEALPQMAWTAGPTGELTYVTNGWKFFTGQTQETALEEAWSAVIHDDELERFKDQWQLAVSTERSFQHASRFKNKSGDYRWHLIRATPIKDKALQVLMWVGTCTDIHDQMLLTEELERKVKERTQSLEVMNNELEQFAHVSSHDLQEPLRKIRTFAELLKDTAYGELNEQSKRYMDKISSTAERMSASLKALLSYTSLHQEEKFKEVDLSETVSQVLVDLELLISQKKAVIEVETLPAIRAVPIQMQQLFYNLVNNALKFSRKDIPPLISIKWRKLPEEEKFSFTGLSAMKQYIEITVQDNGVGFDDKHGEKIFTIFQRLHSRFEFEGTGIGLSLVKKVVINHKGDVYARSKPGEGAAFIIILPCENT